MQEQKHLAALAEVSATISDALAAQDLLGHQRRLMAMLSLGTQHIIELYLHRLAVMKPGAQLKHEWFKLSEPRLHERLSSALTKPWNDVSRSAEIATLARKLELERNDIVYGAPLPNDLPLREHIDRFLEIKRIISEASE
ncbi:hypothetical protein HY642_07340 [Candidatus Woesearchaeota archaeon]|nr:hypothetical protein [Candidatus Woesearchaeota archaeon]